VLSILALFALKIAVADPYLQGKEQRKHKASVERPLEAPQASISTPRPRAF
jgi:hypothetical protein